LAFNFSQYRTEGFYDELFESDGVPRASAKPLIDFIHSLPSGDLKRRQKASEVALLQMGITFSVYGDKQGTEKIFPFDIIPRLIQADEWQKIEAGLKQRIQALNLFIDDVYHGQKILKDKIVPEELVLSAASFRKQCMGLNPPLGIWAHITGSDLVRDKEGTFYVLEDNLRCPSGVSYVLENRTVLKRNFPQVFQQMKVKPVIDYPDNLIQTLSNLAPNNEDPTVVVLTPGIYNSAYFEHAFLARNMGVQLVQGEDLAVVDNHVMLKTTKGLEKVDVIYRRIDDDFIDPKAFRKDSLLGVPGLLQCYQAGNVALANALGTGIADDKAIYAYVPQIIKYYLDQEAIIPNVPTYICSDDKQRDYVLKNLKKLVVKAVNLSGGYGMLIGPNSSSQDRRVFAQKIQEDPRNYIAQPTLALSRAPVITDDHFEGRHVDCRPYILYGKSIYVLPGGLTRVALKKGSLVVNSSQGGGSKDTWVLSEEDI
jgi:uncharacterized circularly permuted ATP-grasp superfamily protein